MRGLPSSKSVLTRFKDEIFQKIFQITIGKNDISKTLRKKMTYPKIQENEILGNRLGWGVKKWRSFDLWIRV